MNKIVIYEYTGEDQKTLLENITNHYKKETNKEYNDSYPLGIIKVSNKYKDTWIWNIKMFSGWKIEYKK